MAARSDFGAQGVDGALPEPSIREQSPIGQDGTLVAALNAQTSSTFVDNMNQPIHRWFRYSAGFAARWVEGLLREATTTGHRVRVLDPFAGAGTVLIEAERCNAESIGLESHPFVFRVARAKLAWRSSVGDFLDLAAEVYDRAIRSNPDNIERYPSLIRRCFPDETLRHLDALRAAAEDLCDAQEPGDLVRLCITSILRTCSPVGTAQWQYVLPNKSKATSAHPFVAFREQVDVMARDMRMRQMESEGPAALILSDDARVSGSLPDQWASLVITSPPYMNNYDYADATRLEMTFWGEIAGWSGLHTTVRRHLVRSCTQHVSADKADLDEILSDSYLAPISVGLKQVCARLAEVRMEHGGKKPYHLMTAAYFSDLARVWHVLRRATSAGCKVCFVIGDSAPYGVHVPVDEWLGELAVSAGFTSFSFTKTRDRNTKWKNRKHTVPLHEGHLWVKG